MTLEPADNNDAMLAAEYVLGLLDGAELETARQKLRSDGDFVRLVNEWEAQLVTLTDELAPVTPGAATKRALLARIAPDTQRPPFWQRAWLWQLVTAMSLALFAVLFVGNVDTPDGTGPLYTAEIVSDAGDFRVVAVVDKSRDEVILTRTAGAAPEGRILQVWAHGPGEPASSVGLWPAGESIRLPMPQVIASVEGTLTIGVSEEPPGGSPTGSPSGRVFGTVDIPGVTGAATEL